MIFTVTTNPMLDKMIRVDEVSLGQTRRATSVELIAGGKGVNVSRQLVCLGAKTCAMGFLGGYVGQAVRQCMEADSIPHDFTGIAATTREGLSMVDAQGTITAVFEPAAAVQPEEQEAFMEKIGELAQEGDWIVCAGSVPCESLNGFYTRLHGWAQSRGILFFLDTYGPALAHILSHQSTPLDGLKMNDTEYRGAFQGGLQSGDDFVQAVRKLAKTHARKAILTCGAEPFYAAEADVVWRVESPPVEALNPVGSGDAMSAALLWAWEQGMEMAEALRWGAAAGAANASRWEIANATRAELEPLVEKVRVEAVA